METTSNLTDATRLLNRAMDIPVTESGDYEMENQRDNLPVVTIPYFKQPDAKRESEFSKSQNAFDDADKREGRPFGDLAEQPDDWIETTEKSTSPREKSSTTEAKYQEAMLGLVDSVLDRFPLAAPTVLLFVGSEANSHVDETCAQVAFSLAERKVGKVLLVDSNFHGDLTNTRNLGSCSGIGEVVNDATKWEAVTVEESAGIDFLPSGKGGFNRWGGAQRLRKAIAEMKQDYQFICVSAGDAHDNVAKTWSGVCDGSYLLVSLKNSNEKIAESAVTELQTSGARLLGCVVTDLD